MIAESMRVPDLWLKRELALSLVPPGTPGSRVTHQIFANCVGVTAPKLSKIIAGDDMVSVNDALYRIAAALEYLVLFGGAGFDVTAVEAYAASRPSLGLWPDPILGTFGQFSLALLRLVAERADYAALGGGPFFENVLSNTVRQQFHELLEGETEDAGVVGILYGDRPYWRRPVAAERIIRQPAHDLPSPKPGDYIQLTIPPAHVDQILFGFEMRADKHAVLDPWSEIGSWFEPSLQRRGTSCLLLPEYSVDSENARVTGIGEYWINVVGIDATSDAAPTLPSSMRRLLKPRPLDWPDGYAETIVTITEIDRMFGRRTKALAAENRLRDHDLKAGLTPSPGGPSHNTSPLARLYRARYCVSAAVTG